LPDKYVMLTDKGKPASRIGNVVLLVASIVITSLAAESAYRIFLQRRAVLTYNATSKPLYEYSASTGYGYIRNTDAVCVNVKFGKLGNGVRSWGDDDFKNLAFGDSFTANPYKYSSWTEYIAEPLGNAIGRNVVVMNLGRDGFGVLQIIRLAANTLQHTKADLAVIVCIVDDLHRARSWRTKLTINGMERLLMSLAPSPIASPKEGAFNRRGVSESPDYC